MKKYKKLAIIAATLIVIVLAVGNAIIYVQPREMVSSSRNLDAVFSDKPVYILGESSKTDSIKIELAPVTSKIFSITQEKLTSNLSPEQDILAIDGQWLETVSVANVADNLRSTVLQGIPVLVISGASTLLDQTIKKIESTMNLAHSTKDTAIHGLKYYPDTGAVSSLEVASNDGEGIIYAYEWAQKYLSNIPIYPEPEHHSP